MAAFASAWAASPGGTWPSTVVSGPKVPLAPGGVEAGLALVPFPRFGISTLASGLLKPIGTDEGAPSLACGPWLTAAPPVDPYRSGSRPETEGSALT